VFLLLTVGDGMDVLGRLSMCVVFGCMCGLQSVTVLARVPTCLYEIVSKHILDIYCRIGSFYQRVIIHECV
jgi:hypothetical protein